LPGFARYLFDAFASKPWHFAIFSSKQAVEFEVYQCKLARGIKENGDAHEDDEKMEDGEGEVKEKEPKEVEAAEIKDEKDEKAEAKDAKVTEPNGTATTIDDEDEEVRG